ncbi:CD3072 family TudS-related putative desulfidase [Anaerocolumna aminovalerica]|uniref:CD3072 family TudS-related putative desulfidase n=1 Tax=Anaerocolumna aminovalerica TaxID=1527 RepID=UPI000BE25EA6|nr:CD3072 family TudS-related putative desulfidase [Anaerocolumna aminovalerica]
MDKILIVSHCILNISSKVVSYNQEEIKQENANREKLIKYVLKNNIQLLQLPCPEFLLYGAKRWGHVKEQFNHPYFRKQCREMLEPIIMQLKEYASYPERFQLLGIIAIDGSPSCGYHMTCKGDWGGEFTGCPDLHKKFYNLYMAKEPGIFMEEMISFLKKENVDIPIMDLSTFTTHIN